MKSHNIRNFCIIAHIDHGKSTLADRILEFCGVIDKRNFREQFLDDMELERERGITIKASSVTFNYSTAQEEYILNLIDTPGHVDFTYEVSKSLRACEGAILLVDASQGIEAQTVSNFYLALEEDLVIIPVLNKIDLPAANIPRVKAQLNEVFGFKEEEISIISAKEGKGVGGLLTRVIREIPPPGGDESFPLKALIFDSTYNAFKGVILSVRIFNGRVKRGDKILMMQSDTTYEVEEVGILTPEYRPLDSLRAGQVGFLCCNIKDPRKVIIGDTITLYSNPTDSPLKSYKKLQPMVFCGIFPQNSSDYHMLREAMEKLILNDPSFTYENDNSISWGPGFRCGFLGLLHMEIVQERLEREYNLNLILTTPSVVYIVEKIDGTREEIDNPHRIPDVSQIKKIQEPIIRANIILPIEYMNPVVELSKSRRGKFIKMDYLGKDRVMLELHLPLAEVVVDFYDKLKSITKGFGSLDYEFLGYVDTDVVRIDFLINGKVCDAFSFLVHRQKAYQKARSIVDRLRQLIPRQQFVVHIQASCGGKIIAAQKISPLRKNVTAKCYGGDITRKMKLWERQKAGKKKMKQFGNVQIPQEAFIEILKM